MEILKKIRNLLKINNKETKIKESDCKFLVEITKKKSAKVLPGKGDKYAAFIIKGRKFLNESDFEKLRKRLEPIELV